MSIIFTGLVAVSVISIAFLFKQALQPQAKPSNVYVGGAVEYYAYGCLGQTLTYSLMLLATIIFIIAVVIPKTYDDYLLGWVVWYPVLTIWIIFLLCSGIGFGLGLTSPEAKFPRLGRFLAGVVLVLLCGGSLFISPLMGESYERTVQALGAEPLIITGDVQDKFYSFGSRGGRVYHVVVHGVEYLVPDEAWYDSLQEGQPTTFIVAPPGVLGTGDIFPPDQVGYTWVSIVVSVVGGGVWLITAVVVSQGMRGIIGRFRSRHPIAPPQPIVLEKKPIKLPKVIELAKPVNYWLLGGGVLMLLLSYLYSLKTLVFPKT